MHGGRLGCGLWFVVVILSAAHWRIRRWIGLVRFGAVVVKRAEAFDCDAAIKTVYMRETRVRERITPIAATKIYKDNAKLNSRAPHATDIFFRRRVRIRLFGERTEAHRTQRSRVAHKPLDKLVDAFAQRVTAAGFQDRFGHSGRVTRARCRSR